MSNIIQSATMPSIRTTRKRTKMRDVTTEKQARRMAGEIMRDVTTEKQARRMAGEISFHLNKTYPGHLWAVNVEQGVVEIKNCFTSMIMGFRLRVTDLDVNFHNVVIGAGEVLERYRLKREKINMTDIAEAKRNVRGVMAHEV